MTSWQEHPFRITSPLLGLPFDSQDNGSVIQSFDVIPVISMDDFLNIQSFVLVFGEMGFMWLHPKCSCNVLTIVTNQRNACLNWDMRNNIYISASITHRNSISLYCSTILWNSAGIWHVYMYFSWHFIFVCWISLYLNKWVELIVIDIKNRKIPSIINDFNSCIWYETSDII